MRCYPRALVALAFGWLALYPAAQAADNVTPPTGACPPGWKLVEDIVYQEVVRRVCKYVPDVKKVRKTVYECKQEPFCLPKCGHCGLLGGHKAGCGPCAPCDRCEPLCVRHILVKREVVTECPTYKCVVETVKDVVPVKVYRAVPCEPAPVTPPPK